MKRKRTWLQKRSAKTKFRIYKYSGARFFDNNFILNDPTKQLRIIRLINRFIDSH